MMRSSLVRQFLVLPLLVCAAVAGAQQKPGAAPPQLEQIEETGEAPITVTSKPENERKITEKREQGKVTEAQVNTGKSKYTVKPNTPAGSALPGDMTGSANRGPQWKVMEFDLGKKKKKSGKQTDGDAGDDTPPASGK